MSSIDNKNLAFNEMMTHIPLCTHKEPKNVLVIDDVDNEFKMELAKHKVSAMYGDSSLITSNDEKNIDIIIITSKIVDNFLIANIQRILKDDGILVFVSENFGKNEDKLKADLTLVGEHFWIAMPFRFDHTTAIIASKKYHPTADIVLQASDLLDDVNYYSTEIHHASFVFPSHIHKKLTGFAKR